ncbi:hypothetical protein [Thiolapillus sp.]
MNHRTALMGVLLSVVLALGACAQNLPRYRGYSFDAMIEDAHVIPLNDAESIPALKGYVREVHWQLDKPISGDFTVSVAENEHSAAYIGTLESREPVHIISLNGANLDSHPELETDESVRFNDAAAVGKVNVLEENRLPKGDYVFRLKVHGSQNWDRKEIYVQVR